MVCFPKGYLDAPGSKGAAARRQPSDKLGYPRAKALNLLTAAELPRRHPDWTSLSLDLGFVQTSIASWMDYAWGFMRSADVGVRPLLYALLVDVGEAQDGSSSVKNGHVVHTMYSSAPALQRRNYLLDAVFWIGSLPQIGMFTGPPRRRRTPASSDRPDEGYYFTEEETAALHRDVWDASTLELRQLGWLNEKG